MGRKKLEMKMIVKSRQRIQTFNAKKECLKKQLSELTTLCNINACMIIYDPTTDKSFVWPEDNPEKFRSVIDWYKAKNVVKRSGVSEFFMERKTMDLHKLRESISKVNEAQLRGLSDALDHKVRIVKSRIQMMKEKQEQLEMVKNKNMINIASPPQNYYAPQPLRIVPPLQPQSEMMKNFNMVTIASPQQYYYAPQPMQIAPPLHPYVIKWMPLTTMQYFPTNPTSQDPHSSA